METINRISVDRQKLIDYSFGFADKLLTEYQEFFPFAATINLSGDLVPTAIYDANEKPKSKDLINKLEPLLDKQLESNERRAYALTSYVRVTKQNSTNSTDAIAVKIKHNDSDDISIYYFAYRLTEKNNVQHLDSWGEII